ncbi:BatD family protein [Aromatoleum toluolicum]|uniref:DUF7939 domain-containing protein n=1 Tax=Aromatoleum toluolicum TaxID=90060 RepID=A0ABX1NLA9_9RHOO|nr:BatD family protein [Aromatoleum toluolicum]NMF99893.1 BatD family protein [Aromatoleum toluolicum]
MVKSSALPGRRHGTAHALARLSLTVALIAAAPSPAHADDTGDSARPGPALWVEAELQPDTLHVQAQARYTLRLYQAVSVRELAFHAPHSALAEIRPAGENIHDVTRNGQRYRVTERHFAVFPFASGTLQLSGGHVSLRTDGASPPERRIDAPPLTRDVSPVPAGHRPQEWLPARAVTLTESWQPDTPQLRPGQALRRTIRIEAKGVAAAQIPPLTPGADGFALHPEPPHLEERVEDGWITGIREQSWRLVPRQGGDLTLPILPLSWWDPVAGLPRQATLPARPIAVMASPRARDIPTDGRVAPAAALAPAQQSAPAAPAADTSATTTGAALLAAIALLATGAAFTRRYRDTRTLRDIRRACHDNDPVAACASLLQWSREIGVPAPTSLLALAHHLGGTATGRELAALDRHLYGTVHEPWSGQALLAALHHEQTEFHPASSCARKRPEGIVSRGREK